MRDMYLNPKKDEVLANNKDSKKDDECRVRRNHCLQVFFLNVCVGGCLPSAACTKSRRPASVHKVIPSVMARGRFVYCQCCPKLCAIRRAACIKEDARPRSRRQVCRPKTGSGGCLWDAFGMSLVANGLFAQGHHFHVAQGAHQIAGAQNDGGAPLSRTDGDLFGLEDAFVDEDAQRGRQAKR